VLGPKTEVKWDWRRLYKEVLHVVYSLPNTHHVIKPRSMRWGRGACGVLGERRDAYRILVSKSEALRPIGKPRHKGG